MLEGSTGEPALSACPRCGVELVMQDLFTGGRHATVGGCLGCGGQWMRRTDLERLSEILTPVVAEWRPLGPRLWQNKPLHCPVCTGAPRMEKMQSERDRRVVLDRCRQCHGVWLDTNELRAIQQESLAGLLAGLVRWS
jgi:Zn-finger nucleic acid-binding protein